MAYSNPVPGIDYGALMKLKEPDAMERYVSSNLSAPSIMTGFLDYVGSRNPAALQSAISQARSVSEAQEREALSAAQRQQEGLYAAEGNARMQLVQKSNELAAKIGELKSSYDYGQNPENYGSQIAELARQKAEIDSQLEAATEALRANPLFKGETLVNPVSVQGTESSANRGEAMAVNAAAYGFLEKKSRAELDKATFNEWLASFGDGEMPGANVNDLRKSFSEAKKELQQIHKDADATAEAERNNALAVKKYGNEKIKLAKEALELDADFNRIANSAKTQSEFENMLKGTWLETFAKQQGLDNTTAKSIAAQLFNALKKNGGGSQEMGDVRDL
jgi:hypothetical protein